MSETNKTKTAPSEMGKYAYEIWISAQGAPIDASQTWETCSRDVRMAWATVERAVIDHYAPRLASLEAETRELHSRVSELRVDAETHRKLRVAAEHERNLLTDQVGRDVLAALVQEIPAEVRHATLAQRDEALKRAAKLDAEVNALRARVEALMHGSETLERERDEARDGWQRAKQAEAAADAFMRERDFLDTRVRHFVKRAEEAEAKVREVVVELAQAEKDRDTFEGQAQSVAELLDEARVRAEKAERERDEAIKTCSYLDRRVDEERALKESAMHGRDEARAEVARLTKAAEDAEDAVTGRLDAAFKDGASRMQAEIDRLKAKATVRGQRSRYECVTPAGTLYLDDPDANGVQFREAVRYAFASLTPRPDAGLAGLAQRESGTVVLDASPTTPADAHPNAGGGPERVEAELPKAERRPPFNDWTDEARAKLVPGASVMWWESRGALPRRMTVFAIEEGSARGPFVKFAPFYSIDGGYLFNCDPLTIEPPTAEETLRQFERGEASAAAVRDR